MKRFIKIFFLFSTPFIILFIIYFICDPFHIFKFKREYPITPTINRAYSGVMLFNLNNPEKKYNSFIIGSSRSFMYHTYDWKKHLNSFSSCFHFDQSGQNLFAMVQQLKWLDRNVTDSINNLLLVMDIESLSDVSSKVGIVYENPPQIMKNDNFISFHLSNIKAFYKPKFIIPFFNLKLNYVWKPYMAKGGFVKGMDTDISTNDFYWRDRDSLISIGKYYKKMKFSKRGKVQIVSQPLLLNKQVELLNQIKAIVDSNNAKLKIVIGPLYNQIKINDIDITILNSIFGSNVIYDFSGINDITNNIYNYYEMSHYRSSVCNSIMDSIYLDK